MKKLILILFLFNMLSACTDPKEKLFRQIKDLEHSERMGTPEGLAELAELHKEYGLKYNDSMANFYLYSAGTWYYYAEKEEESKALLMEFNKRDVDPEQKKNAYLNLANIYAKHQVYDTADQMISKAIDEHLPTNAQWNGIADIYRNKIETKNNVTPHDYEQLSLGYTALGAYDAALAALDSAISKFPNYEKRATLLYRSGFIAWEYMKNTDRAKVYYERYLQEYPEHEYAEEVETILTSGMLEMDDEAILNMLKGKSTN